MRTDLYYMEKNVEISGHAIMNTTYSMERRLAEIRDGLSISLGADEANI